MTSDIRKIDGKEEFVLVPSADIYENANEYVIKADMPGITRENLEVMIEKDELRIRGTVDAPDKGNLKYAEYRLHNYYRSFTVGESIDREKIQASLENGVLTLTLPKSEAVKPRRIEIKVA
jgi:HSP20 family protein